MVQNEKLQFHFEILNCRIIQTKYIETYYSKRRNKKKVLGNMIHVYFSNIMYSSCGPGKILTYSKITFQKHAFERK